MSLRALSVAMKSIKSVEMSLSSKLVLIGLANRHNQETGRCDPSVETIAADMKISEKSVRRGLRELEKLKLIRTVHRTVRTGLGKRNLTNRYRILGGVKLTGGVGSQRPTKQEYNKPSTFDDLATAISDTFIDHDYLSEED